MGLTVLHTCVCNSQFKRQAAFWCMLDYKCGALKAEFAERQHPHVTFTWILGLEYIKVTL